MTRNLAEHSPLCGLDESPIHQTIEPVRLVATTDPRFFERYWFTAHDEGGEFFLVIGFAIYPNLGTVDGYGILVHENIQTTVRAHRALGLDRTQMSVGPLQLRVVEPFTEWHLQLGDNEQQLSFDIRWRDTKRAAYQRFAYEIPGVLSTRLLHEWAGYETFGRVGGTVSIKGKTLTLNPTRVTGSRDHHWGIRNGVGGHHLAEPKGGSHVGQWIQFRDWALQGRRIFYNLGDSRTGTGRVEHVDHRLTFDTETRHLSGGVIRNFLSDGSIREISYEPVGHQIAHLRCAMYCGPDGQGTPDENIHHGMPLAEPVTGESYDLNDAAVRLRIGGFDDRLVRATCDGEAAVGILECRNPALYDMCRLGIPGFGFLASAEP